MASGNLRIAAQTLRADLVRLVDRRSPRRWTLIDSISGRISRLTRRDWQWLEAHTQRNDVSSNDVSPHDVSPNNHDLIAQATAAGLLRKRVVTQSSWGTWPMRALAFRVPLFSIDRVAVWLAGHCWLLFSPVAIAFWTMAILIAVVSVLVGWSRAEQSITMVYGAAGSASAIGYSLVGLWVATKCIHELGHATACRKLGVPVGDVGLFFFCGAPCPYCDVSQVWRLDSRLQRAAVMMAGVYVELVMATTATLVWWLTSHGPLHVIAMNTILLCGLSTLVFNANPLMRMDGYYVLSDVLGTPNLRRQAALAWHGLITNRIAGATRDRAAVSFPSCLLSIYHAASSVYRVLIFTMIATFLVSLFADWNLWWIGCAVVAMIVVAAVYRLAASWRFVLKGQGIWRESSFFRRTILCFGLLVLMAAVACIPIRREIAVRGILDVADAAELFVPESGWVEHVRCDIGDRVMAGDLVASLRDDDLNIQSVAWKTRRTIVALESANLKRQALRDSSGDLAWKVDLANRELVESQYDGILNRQQRLQMAAPTTGMILPASDWNDVSPGNELFDQADSFRTLRSLEGRFVTMRTCWCRVGDPTKAVVKLLVSAEQRQQLKVGNSAVVMIDDGMFKRLTVTVDEVNQWERSEAPPTAAALFVVKCRLPVGQTMEFPYGPIGTMVEARICVDHEPVWVWLQRSMNEALGG